MLIVMAVAVVVFVIWLFNWLGVAWRVWFFLSDGWKLQNGVLRRNQWCRLEGFSCGFEDNPLLKLNHMSYSGISIQEAMAKINHVASGWYLPQVQRQYVWGARYESEAYICLLLDSLYRRYPIGGLVLWETNQPVPFREFVNDYYPGQFARQVDQGRWGSYKSLIYDGQQRLQTLRSVLYYTFNGRTLCFNLLFDKDSVESDETGFLFIEKGQIIPPNCIRMTELSSIQCEPKEKVKIESKYVDDGNLNNDQKLLVKTNLSSLWDVFVDRNVKSVAYFSVISKNENEVNEVFRRLNTGGMILTQIEMVLAKLKARYSDYEEKLWEISSEIKEVTTGFVFSSAEVLQFFYVLVLGTTTVNEARVNGEHVDKFYEHLTNSRQALREYFENYLYGQLKINHASIIPRGLAQLVIPVYFSARKDGGHSFEIKRLASSNMQAINQYFILSQFCDWNTQTMVNAFCQKARDAGYKGEDFPLEIIKSIAIEKNRSDTLYYHQFVSQPWLALKILTPTRQYIFYDSRPQVDHIFPLALPGTDEKYRERVDVLWNFQPMPAGVNNYKRAKDPKEFLTSSEGSKYLADYDFLPDVKMDWGNDAKRFICYRHKQMRKYLKSRYGLKLKRLRPQKNEQI